MSPALQRPSKFGSASTWPRYLAGSINITATTATTRCWCRAARPHERESALVERHARHGGLVERLDRARDLRGEPRLAVRRRPRRLDGADAPLGMDRPHGRVRVRQAV